MQSQIPGEQCVLCGAHAAVRVSGTSFCAPCGLEQHTGVVRHAAAPTSKTRRRRIAAFGILSSGLMAKVLLGAVAVAAVGGVAAAAVRESSSPAAVPESSVAAAIAAPVADTLTTTSAVASEDLGLSNTPAVPQLGEGDVDRYAAAVYAWAECISLQANQHDGGEFDPEDRCGDVPEWGDFAGPGRDEDGPGNSEDAPGHDEDGPGNSEDAPGHDEDGPGNSEDAPGHDEDGPGNSENAPGQIKPPKDKDE